MKAATKGELAVFRNSIGTDPNTNLDSDRTSATRCWVDTSRNDEEPGRLPLSHALLSESPSESRTEWNFAVTSDHTRCDQHAEQ